MRAIAAILRFFFHHLYTTLAGVYDLVAWTVSVGQWRRWTLTALEPLPGEPILELGHGTGHLMLELLRRRLRAIGVDRSAQMTRLARRRLATIGTPLPLVRADCLALPFATGRFGAALSTFPPDFIRDPRFAAEAWRVLRPGAGLTLVLQAEITGVSLPDRLAAWLFRATGEYAELPHGWASSLEQAGFRGERRDVMLPRARVVRIWLLKPALEGPA